MWKNNKNLNLLLCIFLGLSLSISFYTYSNATSSFIIVPNNYNNLNKIIVEDKEKDPNATMSEVLFQPKKKFDITVTGDSYAGYFVTFETKTGNRLHEYAAPAKTIEDNIGIMLDACRSKDKYLIIAIGVNEFIAETDLNEFAYNLTNILNTAKNNDKTVFTFSFMDFPNTKIKNFKNLVSEYDNVIKGLSNFYENTIYIDMKDCSDISYLQEDLIHFNEDFYDILYKRIEPYLN